jgi:hypothetical protein
MYASPVAAARVARAPQPVIDSDAAAGAADVADPDEAATAAQQQTLATQRASFDYEAAERAELEREREVLEEMVQAQLKLEDEIVTKWIAMI